MVNRALFLLALLVSPYLAIGQNLEAFYPFTGNAADASGNGHNGTVNGATLIPDRFGNASSAYSFNGSTNYIQVPHSTALAFGTTPFTVCAWVRTCSYQSEFAGIVAKGPTNAFYPGWQMTIRNGNSIGVSVGTSNGGTVDAIGSAALNNNTWRFVTAVVDPPAGTASLYVNAQYDGGTSSTIMNVSLNVTGWLLIGCERNYARFFRGGIDDIRIYTSALSATQIDSLYHLNNWPSSAAPFQVPGYHTLATLCGGNSMTLISVLSAPYFWSTGATTQSITITQPGDYRVTGTDASGCPRTDTITAIAAIPPRVNADSLVRICRGAAVLIGDTATGGTGSYTYSWTPAFGLSSPTIAQPLAGPLSTTVYYLTVTDRATGCKAFDTVTVIVYPPPEVEAGLDRKICMGDTVMIGGVATGGVAPYTYSWKPVTGLSSSSIPQPLASPSTTTKYTLTVTDAKGCIKVDSLTVKVNPRPIVNAGPNVTTCQGKEVVIGGIATGGAGPYQYWWTPGIELNSHTIPKPLAKPTVTTTFILTVTDTNGCSVNDTVTVTVLPGPVVNAGSAMDIRPGTSVSLGGSATGGKEPYRYAWTPATGLSSSTIAAPVASPTTTTTYVLEVTDANGCTGRDSVTVSIGSHLTADAGPNTAVCIGDSVRLSASGGAKYQWSPAEGLSCVTCRDPLASPTTTTTYRVIATSGECLDSDFVTVTVLPPPEVILSSDVSICRGDTTRLMASGGTLYQWSPSFGLSCTDCADPLASPDTTTRYRVLVTNAGNCTAIDSVTVAIAPQPVVTISPNTMICAGDSVRLTVSGGEKCLWSPSSGLNCTTCFDPVARPDSTTIYRVIVTNATGCRVSDSVIVTVAPKPIIVASPDISNCPGDSVVLTATGGLFYHWEPSIGLSCTDCQTPTAHPGATTLYRVTGRNENGCQGIDSVTVMVLSAPPKPDAGPDLWICVGDSAQLSASGVGSFLWSPSEGLSCTDCQNPMASPLATTAYAVNVMNIDGCWSYDTVMVTVGGVRTAHAHIDTTYRTLPGRTLTIPVYLDDRFDEARIDRLLFEITYQSGMLRLERAFLDGALLDGWKIGNEVKDDIRGTYSAGFTAPAGEYLRGTGKLLNLSVLAFLGSVDTSSLTFTIAPLDRDCAVMLPAPGFVRVDSICGLSYRLMQSTAENYALDGNNPNPFNPTTDIHFSLGLDGNTTLVIYDALGVQVMKLIDEYMLSGVYTATWDATAFPSGLYYYRLTSGAWSRSGTMMLLK